MNFANLLQKVIVIFSRKYILFFALSFLLNFSNLFAQINPIYPDNVYNINCYADIKATTWGIRSIDTSIYIEDAITTQPFVGDIDNDGYSEVITLSPIPNTCIVIYNHRLAEKQITPIPEKINVWENPLAIADVDKDGIAEIFLFSHQDSSLSCYNYNGTDVTRKWIVQTAKIPFAIFPVIADVNSDGIPEIMVYDRIFNAQTGELVLTLPLSISIFNSWAGSAFLFADMDNDGLLEVVVGNTVTKVNITNPHGVVGNTAFLWKQISNANISNSVVFTSVADINLDGFMDVIVSEKKSSGCFLYVWSPYTGLTSSPILLDHINAIGSHIGLPLVADLNNDGYPEIAFTSLFQIQAYQYNSTTHQISQIWQHTTTDGSGATGMTVFDFNQDGNMEIIYRDETHLRIIDGATGNNITTTDCPSITANEYPIVVDLDKDGSADIVVSEDGFRKGRIRSFGSPIGQKWASARSVWNQYAYNVVHINEDLTVPQYQFNPVTTFTNPNTGLVRRPFNHFLQQVGLINQYGEPFISAADLTFISDRVNQSLSCDSFHVKYFIQNQGTRSLKSPFKITIYKDNYRGPIIKMDTIYKTLYTNDSASLSLNFTFKELADFSPMENIVFSLNDAGIGIAQNGGQENECDTNNNTLSIPFYTQYITASICQNQPYIEYGFNLPSDSTATAGSFHFQQKVNSVDSIIYLDLTINPSHSITLEDTILIGEAYNKNGFEIPVQTERGILTFEQNLKNQWHCDSTVQLILYVNPPFVDHSVDLDFPNAFTPEKETNNYFSIGRKRNVKDLKIFIYNRWGGLVYKSSDINFQWDGRDSKGLLVPIGAYVYMIEYHSETAPDITLEKTGIINIVR